MPFMALANFFEERIRRVLFKIVDKLGPCAFRMMVRYTKSTSRQVHV